MTRFSANIFVRKGVLEDYSSVSRKRRNTLSSGCIIYTKADNFNRRCSSECAVLPSVLQMDMPTRCILRTDEQGVAFLGMKVDGHKCVSCGKCAKVCKMDVDVTKTPNHTECIRCGKCITACPTEAVSFSYGFGLPEKIFVTMQK